MISYLPALVAGLLSILIIPAVISVARRQAWFDPPDSRKLHKTPTPRLGGVGIFLSFAVVCLSFSLGRGYRGFFSHWPVLAAMLCIHVLGLWDDFHNLRARFRFAVQLTCAVFVATMGYRFESLYLPGLGAVALGFLSYPLTILWIVGVINALNMIDGMDGLSGGISVIAAFSMGLIFLGRSQPTPAFMAVVLAGSLAGYLFYNFPPAKIFMGDSGSTFLGFTFAVLPLIGLRLGDASGFWLWDGVTILAVPIFDVFAAMWRRTRQGKSVMSPDKWHLHHKLLHLGFGTRGILAMVYAACLALGAVAISVLYLSALAHWIILMASWAIVVTLFAGLHYAKERSFGRA